MQLFPHESSDPMYRNMAMLTGKVYLSWQAQAFTHPNATLGAAGYLPTYGEAGYHFNSNSAFRVDTGQLAPILQSAALVVRTNMGVGWVPVNADKHTTRLTPWSNQTLASLDTPCT